jgi:uncharacterized protein (TIGR03083 family)
MALAATEYDRWLELLRSLSAAEWSAPTECTGWDVRTMASHVLGAAEAHASLRETVHVAVSARRTGPTFIDGMTATQVRDRAVLTPADLVARFERAAPASVQARRRIPAFVRGRTFYEDTVHERWTLAYLLDVIFTRDAWMHRVDTTRATGRAMVLTASHDGRIVADVVTEWAARHGQPFHLVLEGPAGGEFAWRATGEVAPLRLDAVEFCRAVGGRAEADGLLRTQVPF